jgi:hypothetical protein
MFCPNAADWGNVADWVSGIGALAAVIAALWIAGSERRSADRARKIAESEAYQRRAQVIGEAIRLAADIEAKATSYVQLTTFGGGELKKTEVIGEIEGIRSQLQALQQFPMTDPRVFAEIGRIIHESTIDRGVALQSTSYVGITLRQLASNLAARREAIAGL